MREKVVLLAILLCAFFLRLYKINNPIADWHSWRQADTAAVARNFVKEGFDLLRPRYDDLSNISSGQDNPRGLRMVEFPIYQFISAGLFKVIGLFPIEVWLRLVTIVASVGSVYLLYTIGKAIVNARFGLIAAFLYAILPYSIFYGRSILPEPLAVFFALLSIYTFILSTKSSFIISALFGSLSILVKPTVGFVLLPIAYLFYKEDKIVKILKPPLSFIYMFILFTPFILWRLWIQNFPEGIPSYEWLLNGDGIRFKGAWFYWLFGERISKLILGYWGIFFLLLGIIANKIKKRAWFFYWLGISAVLYLAIFATGNVKHDYYQIIIIPAIVFFFARGIDFLIDYADMFLSRYFILMFLCFIILMVFALSWHEIRTFYWINNPKIVEAGSIADKLLPYDAKVIAPYGGDTAFLYQTNRRGWPIGFEIEKKIKKGARYYISINPTGPEETMLKEKYRIVKENDKFIILNLQNLKE